MSHHNDHKHRAGAPNAARKNPVKWGVIVVVALMLAAMAIYVLTVDDSLVPGEEPQPRLPAAE